MRLLRLVWRFLMGVKNALVLLFMLLFFGGLYFALSARPVASVPNGGALNLTLNGVIVDQPSERPPLSLISSGSNVVREIRVRDVIHSIDAATSDNRIKALVLDLDDFQGAGQADLQSIGEALRHFRSIGKPIYAFATAYTDPGYYLASFANEIWMAPMGAVMVTGPGGTNLYYKGLMDKLAVDVHIFRVGTYKSAVEPYIRTDQSPEAKAAAQALVDTIWANWRAAVAKARPRAHIDGYLANIQQRAAAANGDMARAAVDAGLVDRLGNRAEFSRMIARLVGQGSDKRPSSWSGVELADYARATKPSPLSSGPAVGVVYVSGEIVDGQAGPGTAGGDTIADLIENAISNKDIKALVLRVDSPGGSVMASERIRLALVEAKRRHIPIVASFGSVAASGGYWVSTAADMIFAEPSTITGSIGVFAILPTFQNSLAKVGLSADGVKATPYSGEPDLLRGISPEVGALLQTSVEDIYRRFLLRVAVARKLPVARVDQIGQGRVWAGTTALKLGLVDRFGGLDAAISEAARRVNLPARPRIVYVERQPSFPFQIIDDLRTEAAPTTAMAHDPWSKLVGRGRGSLIGAFSDAEKIINGPTIQARCLECVIVDRPATQQAPLLALLRKFLSESD